MTAQQAKRAQANRVWESVYVRTVAGIAANNIPADANDTAFRPLQDPESIAGYAKLVADAAVAALAKSSDQHQ